MNLRCLSAVVVLAGVGLAGCDTGETPRPFSTAEKPKDEMPNVDITLVADVASPASVLMTPCPSHWSPRTLDSGTVVCEQGALHSWDCPDSWDSDLVLKDSPNQYAVCKPPTIAENCPDGQMAVVGKEGCQNIGHECPDGDFPQYLPVDKTVFYVKSGGPIGGEGSIDSPFSTITEAIQNAGAGVVIAIAKGVYNESVVVPRDLDLIGACSSGVEIRGITGQSAAIVVEAGAAVSIQDIKISGGTIGVLAKNGGSLSAQGVWVSQATGIGISSTGGGVELNRVLISQTQANSDSEQGFGLWARDGGLVRANELSIEYNRTTGLLLSGGGTELHGQNVMVRGTQAQKVDSGKGWGVYATSGAKATLQQVVVDKNRGAALLADSSGTSISAQDILITNTQEISSDDTAGRGISCADGASVSIRRGVIDFNREVGVYLTDSGSAIELDDVVISNTQAQQSDDLFGRGLVCRNGARCTGANVLISSNRDVGGLAVGAGTEFTLMDSLIYNTQAKSKGGESGRGLSCEQGAKVALYRTKLDANRDIGLSVLSQGTSVELVDSIISNTRARDSDDNYGRGLLVQDGANVTVTRTLIDSNRTQGVFALDSSSKLNMQDVVVSNTFGQASDQTGGEGISAHDGATVTISRASIESNRNAAVFADNHSSVSLFDTQVVNTQAQESDGSNGHGLHAESGATITTNRALLDSNSDMGVYLTGSGTTVNLNDTTVQNTLSQQSDNNFGRGLNAIDGAFVVGNRVLFDNNREMSVFASGAGTSIVFFDAVIQNTLGQLSDGAFGRGVNCLNGASFSLTRGVFDGNRDMAVFASHEQARIDLVDVIIKNTLGLKSDNNFGRGLNCEDTAQATLKRVLFDNNRQMALFATTEGTVIDLEDVMIKNTLPQESDNMWGLGLLASDHAVVNMNRVIADNNRVAAALFRSSASATLRDCWFTSTQSGQYYSLDSDGKSISMTGAGDGIVALLSSSITVTESVISGCERAGILVDSSSASLTGVSSTENNYGLVQQNSASAKTDSLCYFGENSQQFSANSKSLTTPNGAIQ